MISASPSRSIERGSSEPGFAFGLRDLRSKNVSSLLSPLAASSHHGNFLSPLLSGFAREAGHEPIISSNTKRLSHAIAERDRLSSFSNDSKRRLQKLRVEVVNVKVEIKALIKTLKARKEEIRVLISEKESTIKRLED